MNISNHYNERLQDVQQANNQIKKKIVHISFLRIFIFILGFVGFCWGYDQGGSVIVGILLGTFIPFLFLMKVHNHLFKQKDWLDTAEKHYQGELSALENDHSRFDGGIEYMDPTHPYTYDLDVFGEHSLFQRLNRTCTPYGKQLLSTWLCRHLDQKQEIEKRQQAIQELCQYHQFREYFRITGLSQESEKAGPSLLRQWVEIPVQFISKKRYNWICKLVPAINITLLILGIFDLISFNWFNMTFSCFLIGSMGLIKQITRIQSGYNQTLNLLSIYAKLIDMTDQQMMNSPLLVSLKNKFYYNNKKATDILQTLNKELERLDLRNNMILYVILEGGLFWQVRQMLRIEKWKQDYGPQLIQWVETLGELDALCSLGTFAFNHPQYTYPNISEEPFIFKAKDMGHPLMVQEKCVLNDANIPSQPYFIIITGANMAGKSTYLRTIGTNYLLACIGTPVYCKSLEIYPGHLMTSLRTSDSLKDNESYFFAELKRLHQIIERLKGGEIMFIILDEILKGTNSIDKQKGSLSLVKQLIKLRANGIIATHDLLLGTLKEYFPSEIKNYCFEADITNNELSFSYKLKEGVAQNMNACFLMKKMGIDIDD